jgi:hypothetical protein
MALTNTQLVYIIIVVGILYLLYNNSKKNNQNNAKEPFSLMDTINTNLDKVKNSGFVSSIKNLV